MGMMSGELVVVVGGQFGSEGKGAVTAALSSGLCAVLRVAGPNAGHTVVAGGRAWKLQQVPAGFVNTSAQLAIAAGSEIEPALLAAEVAALDDAGYQVSSRLTIDPEATIIDAHHSGEEQALVGRVGSTGKGVGAARAARVMRTARRVADAPDLFHRLGAIGTVADLVPRWLRSQAKVVVEGTQGFGLGTHAGYYPKCTSSDCTAVDFLSMARVNPWGRHVGRLRVVVAARVHPIRVAGNSGPLAGETTWQDLGLPEEYTTVTNRVRRVGRWDPNLVRDAVRANGGAPVVSLALMMLDQAVPEIAGATSADQLTPEALEWVERAAAETGAQVSLVGTGPATAVVL